MNQEMQGEPKQKTESVFITKWKKIAILGFVGIFFLIASFTLATSQLWLFIAEKSAVHTENILRIGGSTTVYPFSRSAASMFLLLNPEDIITVSQSSTGEGIDSLLNNELELVGATRLPNMRESEAITNLGTTFDIHAMGRDAVAVIVHPSKYDVIQTLTMDQLRGVFFTGEITDWSALDPSISGVIHPYVRDPANSGTAALFAEKITGSELSQYVSSAINVHITTLVVPTLANDPDGIAYAPLNLIDDSVRVLAVENASGAVLLPSVQTIETGEYPLSRDFYLIGRKDRQSALLQRFLTFAKGSAGARIMHNVGFVPLNEIKE